MRMTTKQRLDWQTSKIEELKAENKALNSQIRKLGKANTSTVQTNELEVQKREQEIEQLKMQIAQLTEEKGKVEELYKELEKAAEYTQKGKNTVVELLHQYKGYINRLERIFPINCDPADAIKFHSEMKAYYDKELEYFNMLPFDRDNKQFFDPDNLIIKIDPTWGREVTPIEREFIQRLIANEPFYKKAMKETKNSRQIAKKDPYAYDEIQKVYDKGMEVMKKLYAYIFLAHRNYEERTPSEMNEEEQTI